MLCNQLDIVPLSVHCGALRAGLGGITYWCAIFPVDCIKSAMQTDSIIKGERKYTDITTTARVGTRAAKRFLG